MQKVGTLNIITDYNGKAKAIIKTQKVDTIPFNQVSENYAELDMATKDNALAKWKKAYWGFFSSELKKQDNLPTEDMLIVCETFEKVWK